MVPDAGCASATPCPALTLLNVQGDTLQLLLHQTLNQYAVCRAVALVLAEQIFTNVTPCRLIRFAPDKPEFGVVGAHLGFGNGAFNQVCGRVRPAGLHAFKYLNLTGRIVLETERLTLLNGQFVLRELIHQGRGEVCQLQHALHVAGAEAEGVANLRGSFALPCQRTETCDLLGGMHGGALLVLGNRGEGRNVV